MTKLLWIVTVTATVLLRVCDTVDLRELYDLQVNGKAILDHSRWSITSGASISQFKFAMRSFATWNHHIVYISSV